MQGISLGKSYLLTLLMAWGCARPAPIAADSGRSPNEVIAVALVGSHVVARTEAYRVRVWNLETNSVSELDREHVVGMANDGSVAVSAVPFGKYGRLIEAWKPLSQRSLGTQRFEHGAQVLAVAETQVLIDAAYPAFTPGQFAQQVLPPRSHLIRWDLASGKPFELGPWECSYPLISSSGNRMSCNLQVRDTRTGQQFYAPAIAPNWKPRQHLHCESPKCSPLPFPEYHINSWLFSPDGRAVYFTYSGRPEHSQSRLERWTIESSEKPLERLAATEARVYWSILTVSHDQRTIVLGGLHQPLQLLRAPNYAPKQLAVGSANAATFSADDTQLLTGHEDGHMRLWIAKTLELIRVSP